MEHCHQRLAHHPLAGSVVQLRGGKAAAILEKAVGLGDFLHVFGDGVHVGDAVFVVVHGRLAVIAANMVADLLIRTVQMLDHVDLVIVELFLQLHREISVALFAQVKLHVLHDRRAVLVDGFAGPLVVDDGQLHIFAQLEDTLLVFFKNGQPLQPVNEPENHLAVHQLFANLDGIHVFMLNGGCDKTVPGIALPLVRFSLLRMIFPQFPAAEHIEQCSAHVGVLFGFIPPHHSHIDCTSC